MSIFHKIKSKYFLLILFASFTVLLPNLVSAACDATKWGVNTYSSSSLAGLVVQTTNNGTNANMAVRVYGDGSGINRVNSSYQVASTQYSLDTTTGSTYYCATQSSACVSGGYLVMGYGSSDHQGNTYALDCKNNAGGHNNFYAQVLSANPTPYGYWTYSISGHRSLGEVGRISDLNNNANPYVWFTVNNGYTARVHFNWNPTTAPNTGPTPFAVSACNGADCDSDFTAGANGFAPVTFTGKATDIDLDKVGVQILYRKIGPTAEGNWKNFGTSSYGNASTGGTDNQSVPKKYEPIGASPYGTVPYSTPVTYSTSSYAHNGVYGTKETNMNANGWKDVNASGTPLSTQNTNVVFPAVYLESGTYAWAVRAMDEHIVYSTWVYGGNFTVSNLLNATLTATPSSGYDDEMDVPNVTLATTVTGTVTGTTTYQFDCFGDGTYDFTQTDNGVTTNCGYTTAGEYRPKVLVSRGGYTTTATTTITVIGRPRLSCSVTPQQGLSPLVVRVTLSPLYLPEGMSFDYDMNNDGVYEYKDRPSTVYYTYSTPGKYVIKVRASDGTFANTPCSPADINVTSPSSGNGGEVSP